MASIFHLQLQKCIFPADQHLFVLTVHFYYLFKYVYGELSIIINNLFCFHSFSSFFFSFFLLPLSRQTKLLTQYILNLGKYDQNYDIRDRTRFVRQLIVPNEKSGALSKYAKRIFLAQKPAPVLESPFKGKLNMCPHPHNVPSGNNRSLVWRCSHLLVQQALRSYT